MSRFARGWHSACLVTLDVGEECSMTSPDAIPDALRQIDDPLALLIGLFFHSPVGFQIYRADGHSLVTNPAFQEMFGSEPPPEYNVLRDEIAERSGVLDLIKRAFAGETSHLPSIWYDARELRQVRITEAKRVAIEATFFPLRDADQEIRHVAIAFKDRTAEHELRERVEHERDLLGLIIEQSGDGIVVADRDGILRVLNPEAQRQHGAPLREVAAQEWSKAYGLRDLEGRPLAVADTPLYRALLGEAVKNERWMVERPDGTGCVLSGTATPLRTAGGALAGAVLITRDETALIEDERRLRFQATILENVRDSIIVTDTEGRIIVWNHGAARTFGYTADEALGKTPSFLYPDLDPTSFARDLEAIAAGVDHVADWQGRCKDGSRVWVEIRTTRLMDGTRHAGFIGVAKDITDRRAAEIERAKLHEERQRALDIAEAAGRAKDEFLAMLGHELRNPLSPIVTALQLMKLRDGDRSSKERQVIERQVQHLVRLVDDLLDVSRVTRGKVDLTRARIEIAEPIAKAVEIAAPLVDVRRHELRIDVPSRGLTVDADPERLAQVFSNLITNAAKYTDPGGHIDVTARREGGEVVATVRDDGVGIEPELLPNVFEPFVQGRRSSDRAQGGLGLGLALVAKLVQLHGGKVSAHSAGAGRGSELVVRLPAEVEQAVEAPASPAASPFAGRSNAVRVLVVDDNVDFAEMLGEALTAAGHVVLVTHDGPDALAAVADFRPRVAILDIGLPVMDGYELAKSVREATGGETKLIALTGYGQLNDRERSARAGFVEHFVKPVEVGRLLERIQQLAS